jgi:hypothetical protein
VVRVPIVVETLDNPEVFELVLTVAPVSILRFWRSTGWEAEIAIRRIGKKWGNWRKPDEFKGGCAWQLYLELGSVFSFGLRETG